jgi:glutathione-regulated potassium-efflux system ancillary protein KefG
MNRILILFAHPRYEQSRVNRALLQAVEPLPEVTVHDLYETYPDFNVTAAREKGLLTTHDIVIWQYPLYLYGAPALLKQWMDLVLEFGWAHGPAGNALQGKLAFSAVTTGGARESYAAAGFNGFSLGAFLLPFARTAALCKMTCLPPFAVQGTYRLTGEQLADHASGYRALLERLARGAVDVPSLQRLDLLNDDPVGQAGGATP